MTGDPTQTLLLYFIMPVWFIAGFADYSAIVQPTSHTPPARGSLSCIS